MNAKKLVNFALAIGLTVSLTGCSQKQEAVESTATPEPTPTPTPDPYAPPTGTYFSEMTGLPISTSLKDQRPIAAMVDCETLAFPHYGIAEADIVYDMMNNVMNGRITRFMAVYKDYANIPQIGNIRSARTTNVWLAGEWNAILCHDGEAYYAQDYLAEGYANQDLSGIFTRIPNGKASEFTEYIVAGDIAAGAEYKGTDLKYNEYKQEGDHFNFVKYTTQLDVASFNTATSVALPFPHNETSLAYNESTKSYDLSMYGSIHQDGEDDQVLTFTNVLLLDCNYEEYPSGGYVYYDICDNSGSGYYLTNGKMEAITWKKAGETGITQYFDANGNQLQMNRGKAYISLVPSDVWSDLAIS